jgi:hypothetical protein
LALVKPLVLLSWYCHSAKSSNSLRFSHAQFLLQEFQNVFRLPRVDPDGHPLFARLEDEARGRGPTVLQCEAVFEELLVVLIQEVFHIREVPAPQPPCISSGERLPSSHGTSNTTTKPDADTHSDMKEADMKLALRYTPSLRTGSV